MDATDGFYFEKKYGIVYHKLHLNTNSMVKIALKLLIQFSGVII